LKDLKEERIRIEKQLNEMLREVDRMDVKIRAYLADRQHNPHPRHEDFISRVQSFSIKPGVSTKQLDMLLDKLQWKVYYASRAWKQLWKSSENMRRQEGINAAPAPQTKDAKDAENGKRGIYSVDRLYKLQQERLKAMGEDPDSESKKDFVKRIKKEYGKLASEKKKDEEVVMVFDDKARQCTIEKKKKG